MNTRRKSAGSGREDPVAERAVATGSGSLRKMTFQVKAPDGSKVFIAGSFNNWDPEATRLRRNGDGLYAASVRLPPGRHEYKFVISGSWQMDEQCAQWAPNSCGSLNSVVDVT